MTKRLDPDLKAIRAVNRGLATLPDEQAVQRVLEWTVARAAGKSWITLPRLRWIFGEEASADQRSREAVAPDGEKVV